MELLKYKCPGRKSEDSGAQSQAVEAAAVDTLHPEEL